MGWLVVVAIVMHFVISLVAERGESREASAGVRVAISFSSTLLVVSSLTFATLAWSATQLGNWVPAAVAAAASAGGVVLYAWTFRVLVRRPQSQLMRVAAALSLAWAVVAIIVLLAYAMGAAVFG